MSIKNASRQPFELNHFVNQKALDKRCLSKTQKPSPRFREGLLKSHVIHTQLIQITKLGSLLTVRKCYRYVRT